MATQRVPTINEYALRDYCYRLIGHFDPHPERWTDDVVEQVISAAGGTVGFLVSLVRAASRIEDFDHLNGLIAAEGTSIAEQMTVYIRWAFTQLSEFHDERRTLIFLNDVSPCDIADLERVVKPSRPMLRVLGKLLEIGLVEREMENIYRLTPLLANRLNREIIRPELLTWQRNALVDFICNPIEFETSDHDFLRIESRIQAALISGDDKLPSSIAQFVSAAHWLQAGIRLYHANRHEAAYRLLKKSFQKRSEFAQSTRVEIIRYYCLSAIRLRKFLESEQCIQLLDGDYRTKAISAFLQGKLYESKEEYLDAIKWYKKALTLNQGKDKRLEHTYRPLITCILRTTRPDFREAERYAVTYTKLRHTIFSLMMLARVYLNWKYRSAKNDLNVPNNINQLYNDALKDLANHPGVNSAHFEIRAEEAEFDKNFPAALKYMDDAVDEDPRPFLRNDRWKMIAKYGDRQTVEQALREMDQAKTKQDFLSNWSALAPMLAETYARLLRASHKPFGQLNQFATGMLDDEVGQIIKKVMHKHR